MFINIRRIHKYQCAQLLTTGLLLSVVMVCWEPLDHHVVSHLVSYSYRYLVNSYDFLGSGGRRPGPTGGEAAGYPYLINHPWKCVSEDGKGWEDVLLLLFVKSSPENFERRQAIRDTWGDEGFVSAQLGVNVRLAFAVGVHPDARRRSRVQRALLREDQVHKDLIQQNFVDTFHNLTTKLLLQFHWSQMYCPRARFLMSADDDVFVHTPNLVQYLLRLSSTQAGARNLWVGHVHKGAPPVRRRTNKYHVPYDLYPWPSYPDYTAGAGYVVSADVAAKIYRATLLLDPSMYIDDVFMGMCAQAMGVSPREHAYFSGQGKAPYHPCIYDHMITSHGHADDVRSLWRKVTDRSAHGSPRGLLGNLYCLAVRAMLLCLPNHQKTYSCRAAFT
ncbi:lactosylceramide 1,3-N-acetyl-beta-D-glucosaminyltransferase A-like [Salarias fasciatus]|nr:lactosylceramide 1,3-N-acetyl-beta-D-glucosaminyltransferase A-like [Salarias fasciatus]